VVWILHASTNWHDIADRAASFESGHLTTQPRTALGGTLHIAVDIFTCVAFFKDTDYLTAMIVR
jgi:hypothetical protein